VGVAQFAAAAPCTDLADLDSLRWVMRNGGVLLAANRRPRLRKNYHLDARRFPI
jgi:hypothetical protein